jgi:hypothetical protein
MSCKCWMYLCSFHSLSGVQPLLLPWPGAVKGQQTRLGMLGQSRSSSIVLSVLPERLCPFLLVPRCCRIGLLIGTRNRAHSLEWVVKGLERRLYEQTLDISSNPSLKDQDH